jgi:hypothetical protein
MVDDVRCILTRIALAQTPATAYNAAGQPVQLIAVNSPMTGEQVQLQAQYLQQAQYQQSQSLQQSQQAQSQQQQHLGQVQQSPQPSVVQVSTQDMHNKL